MISLLKKIKLRKKIVYHLQFFLDFFLKRTMDPNNLQDLVRCDLCETIVDSYCDVCNVSLCRPCIDEHISDGYHKHTIVSYRERKSTLIYPKCRSHQQKNCKFQCKDCNDICVCSSCMVSEQHTGHKYVDITEVYNAKKEVIENDTENLENIICPSYKDIIALI